MIGKKINQLATELAPVSTDLTIIGDPISGVSKKITLAQLGAIFSGAVSFYTNLAGFPATGDINVIYCAKDTQKLYLWSGSAYVEVFPSQALLDTYQLRSEKGVSNGYASLDSTGKVPISQLPSSIMEYKGTWNAATNTPTLANGTGDTGDVYICNVAGTVNFGAGPITFAVGDYVIYSGSIWQRSSGAVGTVTSVAASITGNAIGITGSPVTTSGTLAFAFAGTGAQYIKGDGTLATFPSTIAQAERLITEVYNSTGATLTKGTIVYINGGQGNLPTVTKALATGDSTSAQTFGVVQADITNNNNGYVVVAGKLSDLDTQAYTPGTQLYLSSTTAGTWTSTKQYAPAHLVYVGIVVRAHPTQGIVEIKIQNGYELDELHNVAAQTPTNNDGLFWESATSLWKNKSIATVLGYTPQPQLSGTGFVKISGTTISYDNSTYLTTSAAASTYLPLVLNGSANTVDINGQQFTIQGSAGGFTSGRIIVDPVFSAIGYQNAGVFDGLKILTNGNAEFTNSGVTRFFNQVRFDSTLTNGTYTYTLPGATGTIALVGGAGVGTVTSVGLSSATSGVTIGSTPITTSGTITLAIATASGSQQGLLSSTDWTTFNNKQNALTNPVTGTGTTNYIPKFTGTSTIGNSQIFDNGTNVGIGTASPSYKLDVSGAIQTSVASGNGSLYINNSSLSGKFWTLIPETASGETNLLWYYGGAGASVKMNLTNSGNLGLGVNPSAWNSQLKTIQALNASISNNGGTSVFGSNVYYDSAYTPRYISNGPAGAILYNAIDREWSFNQGNSGTAGNAISFTQAMTLNASGFLGIGETNPTSRLHIQSSASGGQNIRVVTSVAAGRNYMQFANGSGDMGYIGYGGADSKFYINNQLNDDMLFVNNGSTRLTIASTGAATFSSSVTAGGVISTTVGDTNQAMRLNSATGFLQFTPYYDSTYGAFINSLNSAASAYLPITIQGSKILMLQGNVGIGTTSPGSYLLALNTSASQGINLNGTGTGGSWFLFSNSGTANGYIASAYHVFLGGSQTDFGVRAENNLCFGTGATERLRITSGGNVGIGTTSPGRKLDVNGVTRSTAFDVYYNSVLSGFLLSENQWVGNSSTNLAIAAETGNAITFFTNGSATERMRITSGGNVGIGVVPSDWNTLTPLQIKNVAFAGYTSGTTHVLYAASNFYYGGSGGGDKYITNGAASLYSQAGGEHTWFSAPTNSSGAGASLTFSERMRITSGGQVLINRTSAASSEEILGIQAKVNTTAFDIQIGTNSYYGIRFRNSSGSQAGYIQVDASSVTYGTGSDYRLKKDLKNFNGLDLLSKIKTYDFAWNIDNSRMYGVIAHELQSVIPYAVSGTKDAYNKDGSINPQGVDYSKIVPVLIKAIQEQQQQIEQLKNK